MAKRKGTFCVTRLKTLDRILGNSGQKVGLDIEGFLEENEMKSKER